MGGQWSTGGRLPRQVPRRGGGREESAGHQGDWDQTPTQTQAPQHHHFQVRETQISLRTTIMLKRWLNCSTREHLRYLIACITVCSPVLLFSVWTVYLMLSDRGVCTQAPCYCILMEYCAQGQLYEVLRAGRKITPSLLVDWSMGIAGGMNYLHLHKIIHRDLKSPK